MYYFVSDTHIGASYDRSQVEARFVSWLRSVEGDAKEIFLVGDIFDFWFEYKRVVPKGFTAVFAALKEITGRGVKVHFLPGNHDMWVRDYFTIECGVEIHTEGIFVELESKTLYIDHGDAVDTGDWKVNLIQKTFRSKVARSLFSALVHPDLALKFGRWWSAHSRHKRPETYLFRGEEEPIVRFCRNCLKTREVDYFVFGHLHSVQQYVLGENSTLFMLGGWVNEAEPVYGVLEKGEFSLRSFK